MTTTKTKGAAPSLPLNQIIAGDCVEVMRGLPEASVDLIFADPPITCNCACRSAPARHSALTRWMNAWDQFASFEAYDTFTQAWLTEAKRLLKPNGAIWVIGSYHNIFLGWGRPCRTRASGTERRDLAQIQPDAETFVASGSPMPMKP